MKNFAELPEPALQLRRGETDVSIAKRLMSKLTVICWTAVVVLGLTLLAFQHETSFRGSDEMIHAENIVSKAAHQLVIRAAAECNETAWLFESAAAATAMASGPSGTKTIVTGSSAAGSITPSSSSEETTTLTSTTIWTTTVTVMPAEYTDAANDETCQAGRTETIWITVYPDPDATVTGRLSTLTDFYTDFSHTASLPDVTLSGHPSTYTAVETDVSYASGPPDATVSGNPNTVTDIQTDVSVTTGLPDATVSGDPSTVTDIQVSWSLSSALSAPFTTLTISDLWDPLSTHSPSSSSENSNSMTTFTTVMASRITITVSYPTSSSSPSASSQAKGDITFTSPTSTYTEYVTTTAGPPAVQTTTVDVFPPAYTSSNGTAGDSTSSAPTTSMATPIIISDASRRAKPKAWGGSSGSGNFACMAMLIATVMFML